MFLIILKSFAIFSLVLILRSYRSIILGNYVCFEQAITFYECRNLVVKNLKIQNAQKMHVSFEKSKNVKVSNLTITSPEGSPNTDGIHVTGTQNIQITDSVIGTGVYIYPRVYRPPLQIHTIFVMNVTCTHVCLIIEGDDCISIVSGSKNVQASDITCGPGHGIRFEIYSKHQTLAVFEMILLLS